MSISFCLLLKEHFDLRYAEGSPSLRRVLHALRYSGFLSQRYVILELILGRLNSAIVAQLAVGRDNGGLDQGSSLRWMVEKT